MTPRERNDIIYIIAASLVVVGLIAFVAFYQG